MASFSKSILTNKSGIAKVPDYKVLLFFPCIVLFIISCVKDPTIPVLITNPATDITINSVTVSGKINSDGGSPITVRGICWGTSFNPTIEGSHTTEVEDSVIFSAEITDLDPNTLYYARAFAENSVGIAYGNEIEFTTGIAAPEVITLVISDITDNTAMSGGKITYDGGAGITAKGICWSTSPEPDIFDSFTYNGTDTTRYQSQMTDLSPATKYYVRAYVQNAAWIVYGEEFIFTTKMSDVEGNLYNTITIGSQVWMAENLRTTKFNDNNPIPNITGNTEWLNLSGAAYCWYNNDISYKPTLGALYSWYTITEGGLCPSGWHVPTDEEFGTLEIFLGMNPDSINIWGWRGTNQGTQMKDTTGWDNEGNGTNTSGFTGLPGGYRYAAQGAFYALGRLTYWWTKTENGTVEAWYRRLDASQNDVYRASTSKKGGKYIRCLKD